MKLNWSAKEVDDRLHEIMINIHASCVMHGTDASGYVNYVKGANVAGFLKVANAMLDLGFQSSNGFKCDNVKPQCECPDEFYQDVGILYCKGCPNSWTALFLLS